MIEKEIVLQNKLGLHARPCSLIAKTASQFKADLKVKKDDMEVNGKSVINLMMLGAPYQTTLEFTADGDDEKQLMTEIIELIENKFYEE